MDGEEEIETEDLTSTQEGGNTDSAPEGSPEGEDSETESSEDGPSQEGELSDEETEGSETEGSEEEEAADEAPPQGKSDVDPLAEIRQEIAGLKAERQALLGLLAERKQAPAPPPPDPNADVPDDAIRMALFGASQEQWQPYSPEVRTKAFKLASEHVAREVRAARTPNVRVEGLKADLDRAVLEQVTPLLEDYHSRKAAELVTRHLSPLKDPTLEARARELFTTLPGAKSSNWGEIDLALKTAAALAKAESREKQDKARENKDKAKLVQKGSTGGTKLKGGGGKPNTAKFSANNLPPMKPGERASDYAARIKPYMQ